MPLIKLTHIPASLVEVHHGLNPRLYIFDNEAIRQCDQIRRFIALWASFQCRWQELFCPNCPHFWQFCKGVKIFHFSSAIIFGQLSQTFGNFLLVTLLKIATTLTQIFCRQKTPKACNCSFSVIWRLRHSHTIFSKIDKTSPLFRSVQSTILRLKDLFSSAQRAPCLLNLAKRNCQLRGWGNISSTLPQLRNALCMAAESSLAITMISAINVMLTRDKVS